MEVKELYRDQKTKAVYQVTSTGESGTVAYQKSMTGNAKKVTIPSNVKIQGRTYQVTSIAKKAFAGNTKIREVSVGKNVRSIGKKAFYGCKNLKKVKNGANVTEIKEGAFRKCTSLTLLVIPEKVKKIGANAYRDCKQLRYIWVKTTSLRPQTIGKNAFAGGYGSPRVKTEKKVWRKYAESFIITGGLSNRSVFVIDPVALVV